MCSVALPELATVTFCTGLELPSVVVAKLRLPGMKVTVGTGDAPAPLRRIDCGLPAALSRTVKLAWRVPAAVGENTKLTEQVVFGGITVGIEQLGVATKSEALAPATPIAFTLSAWSPVFVSVATFDVLDSPTVMLPNATDAGKSAATGPLTACTGAPVITIIPCAVVPPKGEPDTSDSAPVCESIRNP